VAFNQSPQSGSRVRHKIAGGLSILLIMDIAYFLNAMDRQVFPVVLPDIREALDVSPSQVGLLATIFTLGMGLAGLPAGYLADKYGRKKMIVGGLVVFSVTTFLQAFAFGWLDMALYRVVSGMGEGVQAAALYAAAGSYFHLNRGVAIGSLSATYGLGAFTGPALGQYLVDVTGHWQTPLIVYGLLGAVILALVIFFLPRSVTEYGAERTDAAAAAEMGVQASGRLFNRTVICCAVVAASAGFALYAYLGMYPTYLRDSQGFTPGQASMTASMFGIGALAALLGGLLADRFNQRLLNVGGLIGLATTLGLIFGVSLPQSVHMILTVLVGVFFTGVVHTNTNALIQRSVAPALVGRAQGVFIAALYIPASISGLVFAQLTEAFGWATAGLLIVAVPCAFGLISMAALRSEAGAPTDDALLSTTAR
jgi:MFS family permease